MDAEGRCSLHLSYNFYLILLKTYNTNYFDKKNYCYFTKKKITCPYLSLTMLYIFLNCALNIFNSVLILTTAH